MSRLIQIKDLKEGDFFCRYLRSRLIENNKNVIGAELGPTGSGKSYRDLRKAELWYKDHFKKEFPKENICFGVLQAMERLTPGVLQRGEIIIFEEAGVNLGSLDFQTKISKMFNYILQSFRSLNIGLFMNLPYLSMLNKSARMLLHYSSESVGIDFETKQNKCKLFLNQVNQRTGKIYPKYPRVRYGGSWRKLEQINYSLPSQYLIDAYEAKKIEYQSKISKEFKEKIREIEGTDKPKRKELDSRQLEVYKLNQEGLLQVEIAKKLGKSPMAISKMLQTIKKYGYEVNKPKKY